MPAKEPRVALYLDNFLPYTHSWIYRQISDPITNVKLVVCLNRIEEKTFPFEPTFISPYDSAFRTYIRGRLWMIYKYFTPKLSSKNYQDFEKVFKEKTINLVHAHFGTNGVYIAPLCKKLNIPLVVTFHGFDISSAPKRWPAYNKALIELFQQIKYAIAISEEMAERLKSLGCPAEKIKVSYLGVPLEEFSFLDRSPRTGPTKFLHAGRLTAKKGVPDIIKAFAKAFPNQNSAILNIAGDGEEKQLVINILNEVKPVNQVNLLGRLSDAQLLEARNEADVFVLNCRTDAAGTKEGLPISTLEAAATGLPVIGTMHAGIPESIMHNTTGILIEEYDNSALAKAMIDINDKQVQLKMGVAARKFVENKFALSSCNMVLRDIYNLSI